MPLLEWKPDLLVCLSCFSELLLPTKVFLAATNSPSAVYYCLGLLSATLWLVSRTDLAIPYWL